jgi:acyl-CoA synthetase (NDP forming)/GNAT superfamily N-acetyltransferase
VYLRFFSALPTLSQQLLERFTHVDYVDRMALVALLGDQIVAVARYDRIPGSEEGEVAFLVDDAHQGRGLATLLLEHLAAAAKEAGIRRFVAETLPHNRRMLGVFRAAGWRLDRTFAEGVVRVSFDIEPTQESVSVMHDRERRAAAASVARLLRPRSIAVIGASRRPGSMGQVLLRNLLMGGFTGTVYPVNPEARSVASVRAYPSVTDVPDEVDLAIVVVPAAEVAGVVEACAVKRVGALVVVSAGFGELEPAGARVERELVRSARRNGMRVVGPASMGVANTDPEVNMDATLSPVALAPGRVGLMAQSGALGLAILDEARRRGLGVASFVSAGNKADVSGNDLLHYWEGDPGTDAVLLYLESFGNPRTFARVARRVSRSKPIVAVKAARHRLRHGGETPTRVDRAPPPCRCHLSWPSPDEAVEALFHRTGVVRVDTLEQLFDVARGLVNQPLPEGRRVGVVGNVGGPVPLAVDACEGAGLEVATLGADTQEVLRRACGLAHPRVANPVLLPTTASSADWQEAVGAILADPAADAVLAVFVPAVVGGGDEAQMAGWQGEPGALAVESARAVADALATAAASQEAVRPKPVLATILATLPGVPAILGGGGRGVPAFSFPETAALVLSRMADHAAWLRRPMGVRPELGDVDPQGARRVVTQTLDRFLPPHDHSEELTPPHPDPAPEPGGRWLEPERARRLLACYGIHPPAGSPSADGEAAELVLGVFQDAFLGPLVTLGAGSEAARRLTAPLVRILPATWEDAAELVEAVPGLAPPGSDKGWAGGGSALQEVLVRLGRLAEDHPEVAEVHLDPVLVTVAGVALGQPCVRLAPWHPRPELALRRLR